MFRKDIETAVGCQFLTFFFDKGGRGGRREGLVAEKGQTLIAKKGSPIA